MRSLCIDARMAFSSGIGTCIRSIIPFFKSSSFKVILLVDELGRSWCQGFDQILFKAPIYSVQEQLFYPLKVPPSDIFWSPHYNIPLLPVRAKKRVVTIHDACHLALSKYLSKLERIYAQFVMKRALHQSDLVVTDSYFSKTELNFYFGEKSIQVVPPAVDRTQFQKVNNPIELTRVKKKYRLPKRFFLYVGNLKPHKNLSGLLEAFTQSFLADFSLVIVGKSEGLRHSISSISDTKVITTGDVPHTDLIVLYSLAEALVLPSFYEGFGLPPLEAMSCGCPTLVSSAASLPEVCQDASLYFSPENPKEIGETLRKIASNQLLRQELIQKGFQCIQKYSWEKTSRQYLGLFENVSTFDRML